jgi:hypothetical protein
MISFGWMVTRFAWMAHRFASWNRFTIIASVAFCSAMRAWLCQRRPGFGCCRSWQISRTTRVKGFLRRQGVVDWGFVSVVQVDENL